MLDFIIALIAFYLLVIIVSEMVYMKSTYYKQTHKSLFLMKLFDLGSYGEYLVFKDLEKQEKKGARFLFNTYLPTEGDETTEIDVILINKSGIYVFESKNYSGWIFGDENKKMWTQCLPQGKNRSSKKEKFLNPIFQNKLHINTLKKYLPKEYPVFSLITFSNRCTLKDITVSEPDTCVINRSGVSNAVFEFAKKSQIELSKEQIESLFQILYPMSQASDDIKKKHIENIEAKKAVKDENDEMICPKCGGKLIQREASTGKYAGKLFYGCEKYPKCRYIKNKENAEN